MAEHVQLVVVMPVAPRDDVADTVESVLAYTGPSTALVVVDDTKGQAADMHAVEQMATNITVLPAVAGPPGVCGSLWRKVAAAYRFALDQFSFDMLLRLDADALLLGPGLEEQARQRFATDAGIGMLGSYRMGPDGGSRDFAPTARALAAEVGWPGLRHPRLRSTLRMLLSDADKHSYVRGEHALGAAYLHSGAAVREIDRRGWLDLPAIGASQLCDDHLMGLITRAAGFRIADFGGPGDPLALRWKGLPAAPEQLVAGGALVTHSVRSFENLAEPDIRAFFATTRSDGGARYAAEPLTESG
jgi:hypothetical protein